MASRKSTIKTNIEANSEGFLKAMQDVQKSVSSTRIQFKNINEVLKSSSDETDKLSEHKKLLQQELDSTKEKLEVLRNGLKNYEEEIGKSSELTSEQKEALRIAKEEVLKAETQYYNLRNELDLVNKELENQPNVLTRVSDSFNSLSVATGNFASKTKWLSAGAGSILALGAKTAIDYEDAFVGVKKTVEGTDEELEQIRKDIMAMSKEIPISAQNLFELAEEAGQLGIKTADITSFTETMAKLGTATNLSATEAGEAIATFVNVMGTLPENYERIGSVIVELGNNSKATESDIVSMAQRMSGAAATMGMSEADVLGLATALSSVGLEAEMGGTAISRVMNDFNKAASGVETKYGTLSQYAKICGMSTTEFANAVKNNAGEAIKQFVIGLGDSNRTGKETIELMSDLGINEVRLTDTMLRLANAGGTVDEFMQMANEEWVENNALNEEASKKYADTASQIEITKNKFAEVADKLGKILLPVIQDGLKFVGNLADKFSGLSTDTQKTIVKILALTTALSPVSKAISNVSKGFSDFSKFLNKNTKPWQTLIKNITDVNSRTIDLSKTTTEHTTIFSKLKDVFDKVNKGGGTLKTSFSNLTSKLKDNSKQLKDGINYWNQTASATDKLKVGVTGLVGTAVSLKGFSDSLKSISTEGANLGNVAGAVSTGISSIASAASTGASVGGTFGAVIGGVGAALGLVVTGIKSWQDANDNAKISIDSIKESYSSYKASIDSITESYRQNSLSRQDSTNSEMAYIEQITTLSAQLTELVDVNGRVKDSDTQRAETVMTILNESLGTQLTLEDGIIKNGQTQITNKQQLIDLINQTAEAIKKETLLEGYQATYKDAIDAQTNAKKAYNQELEKINETIQNGIDDLRNNKITEEELKEIVENANSAKEKAYKKYQGVIKETDPIIKGLEEVTKAYANSSADALQNTIEEITGSSSKSIKENEKTLKESLKNAELAQQEAIKTQKEHAKQFVDDVKETFKSSPTLTLKADTTSARSSVNSFIDSVNSTINSSGSIQLSPLNRIPERKLGDVVRKPTISWIGEDGAEAVVPLEKHTEWIDGVASKLSDSLLNINGIDNDYLSQLDSSYDDLSYIENLLERILEKPSDFYLDGRKFSEATATTDDVASGSLLEKLERGWVM